MQLGFDFDLKGVKKNEPRIIQGFNVIIPEAQTYFGELSENLTEWPLEQKKKENSQEGLFGNEPKLIEMSVSDFILAYKCPKVFNGYFNKGFLNHPHHAVFEIGTHIDTVAKEFLSLPTKVRPEKQSILREKLRRNITERLKLDDKQIREYLLAFDDFCHYFQTTKLADNFDFNKKLVFKFDDYRLSGKIDFLLKDDDNQGLILLDLKLVSVGNDLNHLQFYDIIQVKLYAYALSCLNVSISKVGYYYFSERTLIFEEVSEIELKNFAEILKHFAGYLRMTKNFQPRKCAYCLICQLREKCEIGRHLTRNDFAKPLE